MRIGFLGPAGTFSEQALLSDPALPPDAELVPLATVHQVVVAVADGEVDRALAPIENSLEGSVNEAVDALVHDAHDVRIVGERVLPVRYCLLARPGMVLQDVRVVLSHPQGLAQCAAWLRNNVPAAEVRARTSTAEAVREVAATADAWAALGTPLAGELYRATTIAEDLGDEPANATRFVWLAREGDSLDDGSGGDDWKSSLVFSGDGDGSPGWLVRCLSEFAFRGVNLTRIESRPARRRLGHYVFLLDLTGRADQPGPAADAIEALSAHCEELRVLGSYRRAAGAPIA